MQRILRENAITSKTSLVDNIQRIGHRLRKSSKKLRGLELLLDLIEKDSTEIPSVEDVRTMDSEYDKRFEEDVKRLVHMKKYKQKYKELLVQFVTFFLNLVCQV